MSQMQRIAEVAAFTPKLMDYGWFVPPSITGQEHDRVKKLVARIDVAPPTVQADRQRIEQDIHRELMDVTFSAKARARYVWLAMRTPHVNKFSHLYESAIFAYYKREYAAAVCLLLVTLEGVLLSLKGWTLGQPHKPKFPELVAFVAGFPLKTINQEMDAIQPLLRDALAEFIRRWIYTNTVGADLTLSVLNRHYVLHGMEAGNFYRPLDAHRLLLAFDILIDLVAITEGTFRAIVEQDEGKYEEREQFYSQLRSGVLQTGQASIEEQRLLKQHSNYVPPTLEAWEELAIR